MGIKFSLGKILFTATNLVSFGCPGGDPADCPGRSCTWCSNSGTPDCFEVTFQNIDLVSCVYHIGSNKYERHEWDAATAGIGLLNTVHQLSQHALTDCFWEVEYPNAWKRYQYNDAACTSLFDLKTINATIKLWKLSDTRANLELRASPGFITFGHDKASATGSGDCDAMNFTNQSTGVWGATFNQVNGRNGTASVVACC